MTQLASQPLARELGERIARGERAWLFLDYDGTLSEYAPTPDTIIPNPEIIGLLEHLAMHRDILRVVIMSGRRLAHIQELLPVAGIFLAGTYGIEFQTWEGQRNRLLEEGSVRPILDRLKMRWSGLIGERTGFVIEDKGSALALHAKLAVESEVGEVLEEAGRMASQAIEKNGLRILGGHKFLEVAPIIANKGQSVLTLLERYPWPGAKIIYIGDDDKDEEAFQVVDRREGITILVAQESRPTAAAYRLESPGEVRTWLTTLADMLDLHPAAKYA